MLGQISMKQLLEAGVHFGHQSRRWNPKMKKYIYTERNGIYIIDLKKTLRLMREAYAFVRDRVASDGRMGVIVGTKKQARDSVERWAHFAGLHYVNNRWLGGTLTNFKTVRKSIERMLHLQELEATGELARYSKKEQSQLMREKEALEKNLQGIRDMTEMPSFMFVIDPSKEIIAISEAKKLGIPVVAIVDTNCDPDPVDYVIPGNDDAIRSINLGCEKIAEATLEGMMRRVEQGLESIDVLPDEARRLMAEQMEQERAAQAADEYRSAPVAEAPAEEVPEQEIAAEPAPLEPAPVGEAAPHNDEVPVATEAQSEQTEPQA